MKKIIVANWKMNPRTLKEAKIIFAGIKKSAAKLNKTETVVCPPFVYLEQFGHWVSKSGIKLGAQDVFYHDGGKIAHTGGISAEMLKNLSVKYAIVGHSERREAGDTDEIISKKIKTALEAGLKVIFCVGEKERDADGLYFDFIKSQLLAGLNSAPREKLKNLIIAYEPVWAISGKSGFEPDDPDSVFKMALFVRKTLLPLGDEFARSAPVLYGGSVTPKNAVGFFERGGIGGLLVGQKSLEPEEFGEILKIAESVK